MTTITDIGTAIWTSISNAIILMVAAIPNIIGFILIALIGWIISGIIAGVVATILRKVKFNEIAQRAGITGFVKNMGLQTDPSGVVANIVKWFIRLIALVAAFDALGLPAVSGVIQQFLLWIPNLLVALIVLVIAGLVATALGDLVRGATAQAGLGNPGMLSGIARIAVWGFAIIIAVNQIGIASTLINILFMGFVGALALALGLSFGLGGHETAGQIVQGWYQSAQQAGPKVERAAAAANQEVKQATAAPKDGERNG